MYKALLALPLLLLFPGSALAAPTASLQSEGDQLRILVRAEGTKEVSRSTVLKARVKSQGALFVLQPRGTKRWVSDWRSQSSVLGALYEKRVALLFQKKSKKWLLFKDRMPPRPVPPDPEDPGEPEDPAVIPQGISASGLLPLWSPNQSDYTVLCSQPVEVSVNIGQAVSLQNAPPQTAIKETISMETGEAFTLQGSFGTHYFRCRPKDLPVPQTSGEGSGSFYLVAPTLFGTGPLTNYLMVLDQHGAPVWWYRAPSPLVLDFNMPRPGVFSWVQARNGPGGFSSSDYTLQGLDGSFLDSISPVGFGADHHDLQPTSDGGWLLIGYVPRNCPAVPAECIDLSPWGGPAQATAIDAWVQKIDASGNPLWTWKSQDHISVEEGATWVPALGSGVPLGDGRQGYDIVHMNSVEEDGNGFIFSARHLDAVYRVQDPAGSGSIDWKLGGTNTPESLQVLQDPLGSDPLGGQHDARRVSDGTVTIHDNGTGKNRPPRMVRYEIDPLLGEATLVSEITDPAIASSFCCGGGRVLPGGDGWAVSWGANSLVAEYDLQGNRRLAITWPENKHSYRVVPVDISIDLLRAGMD